MHYKNGREAKEGDSAIGKTWLGTERIMAGTLHSIQPGAVSCNAQLAVPLPGRVQDCCVTIGDLFHAEDAFACTDAELAISKAGGRTT